tara:strand:- start:749 stop:1588 length:840 start_codon:yes stop_codon:yes gene_type:complete
MKAEDNKPVVFITEEVLHKISLMNKFTKLNTEWSSVTVFTQSKETTDDGLPKEIYVKDIIPMDRGSSVFTSLSIGTNPVFTEYIMRDENQADFSTGLMHTHHSMEAYFSATDISELNENSQHYTFYLSIIVNYAGDIVAKIGVATKIISSDSTYIKSSGKYVHNSISKKEVFSCKKYDCKITLPVTESDSEFNKLLKILEDNEKKVVIRNPDYGDFMSGRSYSPDKRVERYLPQFQDDRGVIEIPLEDWETLQEEIEEVEHNFIIPEKLKQILNSIKEY